MWAFTANDCSMWMLCDRVFNGDDDEEDSDSSQSSPNENEKSSAQNFKADEYVKTYCNAFRKFSADPSNLYSELVSGTTRLLARGVFVDKSQNVRVMRPKHDRSADVANFYTIDYQKLLSDAKDSASQYQPLCNRDAATPCTTDTKDGCNTVFIFISCFCPFLSVFILLFASSGGLVSAPAVQLARPEDLLLLHGQRSPDGARAVQRRSLAHGRAARRGTAAARAGRAASETAACPSGW
jgi:hypothetical protein